LSELTGLSGSFRASLLLSGNTYQSGWSGPSFVTHQEACCVRTAGDHGSVRASSLLIPVHARVKEEAINQPRLVLRGCFQDGLFFGQFQRSTNIVIFLQFLYARPHCLAGIAHCAGKHLNLKIDRAAARMFGHALLHVDR